MFDFGVVFVLLCVFGSFIGLSLIMAKVDRDNKDLPKQYIVWFYHHIYTCVLRHAEMLSLNYQRGRRIGDYGEIIDDEWKREVRYFVQRVIIPNIETNMLRGVIIPEELFVDGVFSEETNIIQKFKFSDYISGLKTNKNEPQFVCCYKKRSIATYYGDFSTTISEELLDVLCSQVEILCEFLFGSELYTMPLNIDNPIDYEMMVAALLKDIGFAVRTTKASGDQGADVLAEKNGISFAIQCKKYSKPVGNKAVQEANAGRDFYKCDYGVVVSNAGFTKSAKQAANACQIILLNERQLEKLLKYVPDENDDK
ncbi:MAG: restriction endonuclease [Alphaproteobacteria bacterium]|nr:restriction endonuclease [Alphaproteobacteria bacterium]